MSSNVLPTKRDPDGGGRWNPEEANYSVFPLEICTMVIVAGWWYLLWFFPLYARHCTLKRESRGDEALRRQYARARSFPFSLVSSFFRIASLINRKKALPVHALSIVPIVLLRILSFSMILRCWMFFCSFLFSPLLQISLIRYSSRLFRLFSLCLRMSEGELASDATYAEKFTKVPTYCPLVAVKYSFDDDEVISSYYTLWHRREWPVRERKRKPFSPSSSPLFILAHSFFLFSNPITNLASHPSFTRWQSSRACTQSTLLPPPPSSFLSIYSSFAR